MRSALWWHRDPRSRPPSARFHFQVSNPGQAMSKYSVKSSPPEISSCQYLVSLLTPPLPVHSKETGKDYILELNDTAIGLVHKYEEEDMGFMADIVMAKMNSLFASLSSSSSSSSSSADSSLIASETSVLKEQIVREQKFVPPLFQFYPSGSTSLNFFT